VARPTRQWRCLPCLGADRACRSPTCAAVGPVLTAHRLLVRPGPSPTSCAPRGRLISPSFLFSPLKGCPRRCSPLSPSLPPSQARCEHHSPPIASRPPPVTKTHRHAGIPQEPPLPEPQESELADVEEALPRRPRFYPTVVGPRR
jgi:hypothetical protein